MRKRDSERETSIWQGGKGQQVRERKREVSLCACVRERTVSTALAAPTLSDSMPNADGTHASLYEFKARGTWVGILTYGGMHGSACSNAAGTQLHHMSPVQTTDRQPDKCMYFRNWAPTGVSFRPRCERQQENVGMRRSHSQENGILTSLVVVGRLLGLLSLVDF